MSERAYTTLAGPGRAELTERRSRFIGSCAPVSTESEAQEFINSVRAEFCDASHNVPAFLLREGGLSRCSDDREPSGTAGRPVLEVLSKGQIVDAAIVVTRYFGGVLLGTGGLVRAYTEAASRAVKAAGLAEMALCAELEFEIDYPLYESAQRLLASFTDSRPEAEFGVNVRLRLLLDAGKTDALNHALGELTGGRTQARELARRFAPRR